MNKRFLKLGSLLVAIVMLSSCSTKGSDSNSSSTPPVVSDNYYKLTYYDQLNESTGYNTDLFYQNNNTESGADPSVIYGKGNDGKEYFYVFPTGTNYSIYGYRSTDMSNWKGVGTVFLPESKSWAQSMLWAPDVIYDADADDGQGGKGLYYMFFTASDAVRSQNNSLYFDNREDRATYMALKDQIHAQDGSGLISELNYTGSASAKATELCSKYSIADKSTVTYELGLYKANKQREENRNDITDGQKQANILSHARAAMLAIRSADVHKLNGGNVYAGMVATAKTLDGPFVQYVNDGSNGERKLSISEPFLAHEDIYEHLAKKYDISTSLNVVDMHPYVDPVTGDKYMYFNSSALAPHTLYSVAEIFVVKVGDKNSRWTDDWQWDTVKQLTRTGYVDMGENENAKRDDPMTDLGETDINEGPYVIYNENNGKYYLTISKGRWQSSGYSVIQAIGDSPMGPFKKLSRKEGGIIIQTETHWDHVVGPGHHSLIQHNGKTYIVYHQHINKDASGDRAISMDEIKWIKNQNGEWIMYCNGVTKSPQLRLDCGYRNIADKATVSVSNDANGTKASLTDGLISATSELDFVKEFTATANTVISLDFGGYRSVRGLMIYNSREYEKAFTSVRRIEFDFTGTKDGQKVTGTAYIDNLAFNQEYFYDLYGTTYIRPGTAAIAEFEEMHVKSIRIIVSSKTVNVSEIVVIGR